MSANERDDDWNEDEMEENIRASSKSFSFTRSLLSAFKSAIVTILALNHNPGFSTPVPLIQRLSMAFNIIKSEFQQQSTQ